MSATLVFPLVFAAFASRTFTSERLQSLRSRGWEVLQPDLDATPATSFDLANTNAHALRRRLLESRSLSLSDLGLRLRHHESPNPSDERFQREQRGRRATHLAEPRPMARSRTLGDDPYFLSTGLGTAGTWVVPDEAAPRCPYFNATHLAATPLAGLNVAGLQILLARAADSLIQGGSLPSLYGIPPEILQYLNGEVCGAVHAMSLLRLKLNRLEKVQMKILEQVALSVDKAPTTWRLSVESQPVCTTPPFCLDSVPIAAESYRKFYFPMKYMVRLLLVTADY